MSWHCHGCSEHPNQHARPDEGGALAVLLMVIAAIAFAFMGCGLVLGL